MGSGGRGAAPPIPAPGAGWGYFGLFGRGGVGAGPVTRVAFLFLNIRLNPGSWAALFRHKEGGPY